MRPTLHSLCLLALMLCLAAASMAAPPTSTLSADAPTTRIVSLVPNITELLFTIGAGDQVVGVSDYCLYPPRARQRPHVGGLVNPSLEAVIQLRPTVVILYRSQQDFATKLKTLGIPTQLYMVDNLPDLDAAITRTGTLTGHTTAASALTTQLHTGLDQLRHDAAGLAPLRGLIVVSRDSGDLRNIYQATFLSDVFQQAGGTIALPGATAISREDIIRTNPDIIIDFSQATPTPNDAATTAPVKSIGPWQALTTVAAVRNGQVYNWPDTHAMLLGPGILDTGRDMQKLLRDAQPR